MSDTVAVIGASGVLGRATVPRLLEAGHQVRALVRSAAQAVRLRALGAVPVSGDILDPHSLAPLLAGCSAALHLATAIPKSRDPAAWATNDRVRREGTTNLIAACAAAGARRYVQQSIAMLQGGQGEAWADEAVTPVANRFSQSALDMEGLVQASGLDWLILRGGMFYGPGTGLDAGWRQAAREGTLRVPGDGNAFISLIEVSDMAAATVSALVAPPRSLVAVVDDEPARYRALFGHVAAVEGMPAPAGGGPDLWPSFRVTNRAAKALLGWRPHYRSFRSGIV